MPPVAALIPAVLVLAGASTTVVAAATLAIGVALTVFSVLTAPKQKLPKPSDGQANVRQQNGPRWRWYGRVRQGGQMFFFDSTDGVLHVGVIFHHGEVDAFEEWWIDGAPVTVEEHSSSPLVLRVTTSRYVRGDGTRVINIRPQDGSANVADAELISKFPSIWTSDHKLLGLANAVVTFRSVPADVYTNYYPNGRPELTVLMRAEAEIFDPRDSSTAWSDNAGLVIRDYLTHPDGMNIDEDLIDDDVFGDFADLCDESVVTGAGHPEILTNRDFSRDGADWSEGTGVTISGGEAHFTDTGGIVQSGHNSEIAAGVEYRVTYEITDYTSGDFRFRVLDASNTVLHTGQTVTAAGTYTETFTATGDEDKLQLHPFNGSATLSVGSVSWAPATEARYRIWGGYPLDAEPATVLQRFLDACDARLYQTPAGKLGIRGGQYTVPTVTLGADQILDANFRRGSDALARYNTLRFTYLEPGQNYREQEGDAWVDADLLAANGDVEETSNIELEVVPSHSQARRLAKIRIARDNPEWIGEIRTTLAGMDAWTEEYIKIQVNELDIDGPFRVDEMHVIGDGRGVMLNVSSVDPDSYDWTLAEGGTRPGGATPSGAVGSIAAPTGVEALVRRSPLTGSDPAYSVTVMWDEPTREDLEHEIQHREAFTLSWESESAPSGQNEITGISAQAGDAFNIRVRPLTTTGLAGEWSTTLDFALDTTSTTPGDPTGVSASDISGGITVDWTADTGTEYADIFVNDTNDFSGATRAHTKVAGSGAQSASFDWDSGTWWVWVRAYGGLGDPTSEVAAGSVVVA